MASTKLTDRGVASAKATNGQRLEIWDSVIPGLFIRVSDKTKVWGFRWRTAGVQHRIRLGHYVDPDHADGDPSALTVAGARAKARKLRTVIDDGGDPVADKADAKAAEQAQPLRTVEDLAEAYFTACEKGRYRPRQKVKRATTIAGERWLYGKHIKPHIGSARIEAVTRAAVSKPLNALADEGKGVMANRTLALVRQLYAYAIKEGRVTANPAATIDAPVVEKPRENVLTDDQLKALWAALKDTTGLMQTARTGESKTLTVGRPMRIALQLALLTMQRRGEVSNMRVADIDLDDALWVIPGEATKSGRPNIVPLTETAVALIREALALRPSDADGNPSPWVFPGHKAPMTTPVSAAAMSHAMRDLRSAIGAEDLTVHDLRRSSASRLGDAGVSPFNIGLILNHAGETGGAARVTTGTYVRSRYVSERKRTLLTLERLILEAVGEREPDAKIVKLGAVG